MQFHSTLSVFGSVWIFFHGAVGYLTPDGTVVIPGASSYNGLNLVPQMGWDTWYITP
jgi:hypothetical protein